MKKYFKIIALGLFILQAYFSVAQNEKNLLPFSNKLLLNPSFAGMNENTRVYTSFQFHSVSKFEAYNEFTLSYDKYSEKLNGGLAFYFQQGLLGDLNINTTEIGFTVTRQYNLKRNSLFVPSINLNLQGAGKQWFVNFVDNMLDKQIEPPSPPGAEFARYVRIKPRVGLLYDSPVFEIGLSALVPFSFYLTEEKTQKGLNDPVVVLHATQKMRGRRKGLVSEPFQALPEAIVLVSKDAFISRIGINVEQTSRIYALFLQNNFTENYHGIGGTYGWKTNNFRFNLTAGMSLPVISEKVTFFGEATLGLIIPPVYYSKKNPWAPKKKLF